MDAGEAYCWLMERSDGRGFDDHVLASILALALSEGSACEGTGIEGAALRALVEEHFPGCGGAVDDVPLAVEEEESAVRDILLMHATGCSAFERHLARMIARRCSRPHHLWQDLGLRNRGELSELMSRYFAGLSRRNAGDMKWKKFLYRMVCSAEGFTLCTAPVCSDCNDFARCFGAEDGESLMARIRNGAASPTERSTTS